MNSNEVPKSNLLNNSPLGDGGMETKLWEYIDGMSQEPSAIEKLITENNGWKAKYNELLEIHQLMQSIELEQPSLRFTKKVLDQITQMQIAPATKQYINKKIIWSIAIFFLTVIVGFLIYGFAQIDLSASGNASSTFIDTVTNADYSKVFNNTFVNFFMLLNVILGLLLLDRYLNMKRKKFTKAA